MSSESIKKSHFRYAECQGGNLHTGEVMSLVCVDSTCQYRGLICPICRMETHDGHYILPIKTFLQQIQNLFMQSDNTGELNNLTDYLRSLEKSRKQILGVIRDEVTALSNSFKELEQKVQEIYFGLRKSVLAQSSITTKLPGLLTLLVEDSQKDPAEMQKEFKKYCELLKYENEKIKVSDKAKKIVEAYSEIPSKVKSNITKMGEDYAKALKAIPNLMDKKEIESKSNEQSIKVYTFSDQNKSATVTLSQYFTKATLCPDNYFGLFFVNQPFKATSQSQLKFRIIRNESGSLIVGVGDPVEYKKNNYYENGPGEGSDPDYISCYGENSFQILSEQVLSLKNSESDDEQQKSVKDKPKKCFEFSQAGTTISIQYVSQSNSIQLKHEGTKEIFKMKLKQSTKDQPNCNLFFSMGENDCIQIINEKNGKDHTWG